MSIFNVLHKFPSDLSTKLTFITGSNYFKVRCNRKLTDCQPISIRFKNLPKPKLGWLINTSILTVMLTGCNTVSVKENTSSQIIELQRGSIVTQGSLSTQSISFLLSHGIDKDACLAHFDTCLDQLEEVELLESERQIFAYLSELHYAKAEQIKHLETCQVQIDRPPINPYYANAPIPDEELEQIKATIKQCNDSHLSHLVSAIRYSYAYLFYNDLDGSHINGNSDERNLRLLTSNTEVQTKDIYNAAIENLIKILYSRQRNGLSNYNVNHFEEINIQTADLRNNNLDRSHFNNNYANNNTTNNPNTSNVDSNNYPTVITENKFNPLLNVNNTEQTTLANSTSRSKNPVQHQIMSITVPDLSKGSQSDDKITLSVYLPNEIDYISDTYTNSNANEEESRTSNLYSSYDLSFSGLNSISQREGVGVSFVTQLTNRQTTTVTDFLNLLNPSVTKVDNENQTPQERIYRTGNLLLTGVIVPTGTSIDDVINSTHLEVNLYNPYHVDSVNILGEEYRLAANFSASYGLWLSENQLSSLGRLNMLFNQQSMVLPQLYKLEPYDPNKRIIIMIHGLASSPTTWVGVTNDIFNDEELRKNYQVWQVFYPTNIPMVENRYQIQKLLETAFQDVDPNNEHEATKHTVLIAHSMGAVISRMMLSNNDLAQKLDELDNNSRDIELNQLIRQSFTEQNIDARLNLNKLDNVDRAVFVSAPFRGTDFADRWFTRALRRIIRLPLSFVQTITGNLTSIATEGELAKNPLGALYLENGASQLSDQSSFMKLTSDIEIDESVTYHSIIANDDPDIAQGLAQLSSTDTRIDLSQQPSNEHKSHNTSSKNRDSSPYGFGISGLNMPNELAMNNAITDSAEKMAIAAVNVNGEISQSLTNNISDGIVPYESAHLEGAASETIITGGHGIQDSPQAILVLRRILHQQLNQYPINLSGNNSNANNSNSNNLVNDVVSE